ncbi:MAG: hypothetical protein IJS54_00230 [Desulfovibrio sp.]|nr:hypothetical protein [Desulfovibrio sp.]
MTFFSKRVLQWIAGFFAVVTLVLLGQIDSFIYTVTEALFTGWGWVVCGLTVLIEIFGLVYLYKAFFARPARLVLKLDASDEERAAFTRELHKRLLTNPHIKASSLDPSDPNFVQKALAHLDVIADKEIRSNGKKVFLGTALAQNGRLDAVIVFVTLCRMVWRISGIYNQKPSAEEFMSVIGTVSSSTFVAFSIDALDIPQMITDTMNEMVPSIAPAVAAQSVPFFGSCLHVFTHSLIDGAANCLLAVRAGIITRRAYSFGVYGGKEGLRQSCVRETAQMMLDISQESVGYVVSALKKEIQEVSAAKGKKLAQGVKETAQATVEGAGKAVGKVKDGANYLMDGAQLITQGVGQAASQVTDFVVTSAKSVVRKPEREKLACELKDPAERDETKAREENAKREKRAYERKDPAERDGIKANASDENAKQETISAERNDSVDASDDTREERSGVVARMQQGASALGKGAGRAAKVVGEGTGLLVHEVGQGVNEGGKKIASFFKETKVGRWLGRKKGGDA